MKNFFIILILSLFVAACDKQDNAVHQHPEVEQFLAEYNSTFQKLLLAANEAEWLLNTKIIEGDTTAAYQATQANEALAKFTGSKENIEKAKEYLQHAGHLSPLNVKQLKAIYYMAGANPEVAGDIVKEKIAAEAKQTEDLFGFDFKIAGKSVSTNDIDKILSSETNLAKRLEAWEASKEVGKNLKEGLANLQGLRNKSVQALGFSDYFAYQVEDYGMTTDEMLDLCNQMIKDLWPLYRELHTWARYELADKYKKPVPDMLPASWLPNRWGQEWNDLVNVEGIDLDATLSQKSAEWIVKEGEKFYISMGFPALPQSFYDKSSLYPLAPDAGYKKNNHASAWHFDNDKDVRSLMSVEPNTRWWGTTLHELGHIYYYMTYSNPDVPIILRNGANRAFHEGIGTMLGMASMQVPFLQGLGLVGDEVEVDQTRLLLKEALDYVVVVPWGAGVMTFFEYALYAENLPKEQYNKKWWDLVRKYQGIVPDKERGEEYCDAATKTHINNDPAQYYDYAISTILFFQLHDHIAKNILKQDPHATNYYGSKEIGNFLKEITYNGANVDWRKLMDEKLGSQISAQAMVDYFSPLMPYLKEINKGRNYTLPESID